MTEKSPTQIALDKLREEWTAEERKRFDALLQELRAVRDYFEGKRPGATLEQVREEVANAVAEAEGGGSR